MIRCNICSGNGFIVKPDPTTNEPTGYPCECRIEKDNLALLHKRLSVADIPTQYWGYTLQEYKEEPFDSIIKKANLPNVGKLEQWVEDSARSLNKSRVLWVWGKQPVACHTSLSVAVATELMKKGYKVKFLLMQKLLDAFTDFDGKKEYFQSLESIDVFLLDNAFMATTSVAKEYTLIHLYNWLVDMLARNKMLICSSKRSIDDIADIGDMFSLCKYSLLKHATSLEFQGTLSKIKKR